MARQTIGATRLGQRTAGAASNANFAELYDLNTMVTLDAVTANATITVPSGFYLEHIAFQNITANAVTGGVKIGTTNGGTDVVAAQAVGANALDSVAGANILKRVFSTSGPTTLYIQAVTAWNGASLKLRFALVKMF